MGENNNKNSLKKKLKESWHFSEVPDSESRQCEVEEGNHGIDNVK